MNFKKPLDVLLAEAADTGEGSLKRTLSSFNLVALGIGAIIGAGLFSLTGIALNLPHTRNNGNYLNNYLRICKFLFLQLPTRPAL